MGNNLIFHNWLHHWLHTTSQYLYRYHFTENYHLVPLLNFGVYPKQEFEDEGLSPATAVGWKHIASGSKCQEIGKLLCFTSMINCSIIYYFSIYPSSSRTVITVAIGTDKVQERTRQKITLTLQKLVQRTEKIHLMMVRH